MNKEIRKIVFDKLDDELNKNLITLVKLKLIKIVYIFCHGKKASKLLDSSIFYKTHLKYYCWISEYNVPFDSIE